ncbi:carbonic anhydrase [Sulfurivirga sp.]|uniref:carbonic anhydrase n=1 Tax=Sulfurivirga sp. TaxID=2614236 RepID=UPI0025F15F2B|nr:carbonic anhydrase family protein [Sulfurivirga sp.]
MKRIVVLMLGLALSSGAAAAEHGAPPAGHKVKPVKLPPDQPIINLEQEAQKYAGGTADSSHGRPSSEGHAAQAPARKPASHKKAAGKHGVHWGYRGDTGPRHWGDLSPDYILCKLGRNQSPVDIRRKKGSVGAQDLPSLEVVYGAPQMKIVNNGHTVQVSYPVGNSYIKVGDHRYELLQFHFHTPSEHQLDGFNYPMEMHLVHRDGDGNLAVIGILFKEGAFNNELEKLIRHLPKKPGKPVRYREVRVNAVKFFPKDTRFYKYSGSLTTPPCSEGVYWMVFKTPVEAAPEQLEAMERVLGANNRPVQPRYARHILKSWFEQRQDEPVYYY